MQTKVILSEEEKITIGNTAFFSVKREIISKIITLFGEIGNNKTLNETWRKILVDYDQKTFTPKISKGENYLGLPYLILDFPKKLEDENQFAVRNFFWWGNYFSTFFILSGKELEMHLPKILSNYKILNDKNFYISTNTDRWIHSVDNDYYKELKNLTISEFEDIISKTGYLKIASILPLYNYEIAYDYFLKQHMIIQNILI